MRKYLMGTILVMILLFISIKYPLLVKSISLVCILTSVIVLIHGKRISLYSCSIIDTFTALKGNALAIIASYISPAKTSELIKPLYYVRKKPISFANGSAVVVIERFYDVITFFFILPIVMCFLPGQASLENYIHKSTLLLFGLLLLSILFIVLYFKSWIHKLISLFPGKAVRKFFLAIYDDFNHLIVNSFTFYQLFLTIIVWCLSWISYWLFLQLDGGPTINLTQSLVIFVIGTLGIAITITPGGIVSYEAIMIFTLTKFGYSPELAVVSALGLRLIFLIPNIVIALYTLFLEGFDILTSLRLRHETS